MTSLSLAELLAREEHRRGRRNLRDRMARDFISLHPDIKSNPEMELSMFEIPEGTTENAIRGIARFYQKKALVRSILKERNNNDEWPRTEKTS